MPFESNRDATIIVKAFERRNSLLSFIESVRKYYPAIKIIITDDSEHFDEIIAPGVQHIRLPFDTGLAEGRNIALSKVNTPYFLLCDDDFYFTRKTNIDLLGETMQKIGADIISGSVLNYKINKNFKQGYQYYSGTLEIEGKTLVHRLGNVKYSINGFPIYDIVLNFFLAKTEKIGAKPWNPIYKIGGEHYDFFLNMQEKGLLITEHRSVCVEHKRAKPDGYVPYRDRGLSGDELFKRQRQLEAIKAIGSNRRKIEKFTIELPSRLASYFSG